MTAQRRAIGAALLAVAVVAGCLVTRKSTAYECDSSADCPSERRCDRGYCVVSGAPPGCPAQCTGGCDPIARTCAIACTGATPCGRVTCPPAYSCDIQCSGDGACDDVTCPTGAAGCRIGCNSSGACEDISCGMGVPCDVRCSGDAACIDVDCGPGARCAVECAGRKGCDDVRCATACSCDVSCPQGACGMMRCPMVPMTSCTQGGAANAECDADYAPQCNTCAAR